jgi:polyisoprenoid-binding protein YceI
MPKARPTTCLCIGKEGGNRLPSPNPTPFHHYSGILLIFCRKKLQLCGASGIVIPVFPTISKKRYFAMKLHHLFVLLFAAVLFACSSQTETTETAQAGEAPAEMPAGLADGEYMLASGSLLNWEGSKLAGTHNGTINVQAGKFSVAGGALTGGSFTIDMNSINCLDLAEDAETKAKLEGHLKADDFFGVATYPTASFAITGVKASADAGATHEITGSLTIKDKTESITFPATVTQEGDAITTVASFVINRAKFDVRYGSASFFDNLGDKVISDEIKISFSLTASKGAVAGM